MTFTETIIHAILTEPLYFYLAASVVIIIIGIFGRLLANYAHKNNL